MWVLMILFDNYDDLKVKYPYYRMIEGLGV